MSSRTLKLTSPAMHGSDVKGFQHDLNNELARWGIHHRIPEDGRYGMVTRDAAVSVCHGLGLASSLMDRGATPAVRLKVRNRKLTTAEQRRFHDLADWRAHLKARYEGPEHAIVLAVGYAIAHVGVKEDGVHPNRGVQVDRWERACGILGAPWCGCFVNACLVAAGFPNQPWLIFCPTIEGRAKAGVDGWSWHRTARVGDLVLYGQSVAEHVGKVVEVDHAARDKTTIEGNTTGGPGGPQADGGMVAERHRHGDGSLARFPIRGYARAPWSKAS